MAEDYDLDPDEQFVEAYDCKAMRAEPLPDLAPYQPMFKALNDEIAQAADLLRTPLEQSPYKSRLTDHLVKEVQGRTVENGSNEVMFAVVGDMASGKSSLINSILRMGMIARKGDSGRSCTWVVQRFMKTFPDQHSTYAAKVYFYNKQEIKYILRSLLAKYWRAVIKREPSDEDDEADGNDDGGANFTDRSTVIETLRPLFSDKDEFESDEAAMEYLKTASCEFDEIILDELMGWAIEALDSHLHGDDCVRITASTADELLDSLQPFTHTLEDTLGIDLCQPWPLVRQIDFGLDIPLLNDGAILVDSPGVSDANSTRAASAKKIHLKCGHRIYVTKVGRARDDRSIREAMCSSYHRRGAQNAILVLTHGDDIDGDTEVSGSPLAKKEEKRLSDEIKNMKDRRSKLNVKNKSATADERQAVVEERQQLENKQRDMSKELKILRLKMRNDQTKSGIQQKYKQITSDGRPLPIYVVANEAYAIHESGHFKKEATLLDVEGTGIPALRAQLYAMPAEGRLNDTLNRAERQLPLLINFFEAYCSRRHIERKSEIEDIVLRPTTELEALRVRTLEKVKEHAKRIVLDPMKAEEEQWVAKARNLCKVWAQKYARRNYELFKSYGYSAGRGKSYPATNWNKELIDINKSRLEDRLNNLCPALKIPFAEMCEEVKESLQKAKDSIREDKEYNLLVLEPLAKMMISEEENVEKLFDKASRQLRDLIADITEIAADAADGYFATAMVPIYDEVAKIKKTKGCIAERANQLEKSVCKRNGVWMKTHNSIEKALNKLFKDHLAEVCKELTSIFKSIHGTFILYCNDAVAKTEVEKQQEEKLRKQLQKNLIKARELVEGSIKDLANECKNYSAPKV